jgi:hypothetical protein
MKRFLFALACLFLNGASCASYTTDAAALDGPFVVAGGTSFGMCGGYCTTELTVDGTLVRFRESSMDTQRYPTRTRTLQLTQAEWDRIRTHADRATVTSVAGVHGCPDCADGGAEWVEIRTASDSVRVTFEYGRVLAPIASLQEELRALRRRFTQP